MKNKLVLYDIDGTLVDVFSSHVDAHLRSIRDVFNVDITEKKLEQGYGLPYNEVVAKPLRELGFDKEQIRRGMDEVASRFAEFLGENVRRTAERGPITLPGIPYLLEKSKELGIPMGVITSNIKKGAEAILDVSDLAGYFNPAINSFDENYPNHYRIVKNAIDSALKQGIINSDGKVYVFGDTSSDVIAARQNGCISIANVINESRRSGNISSGQYMQRRKSLEQAGANYIINDHTDTINILSILGVNSSE